MDEHTYEVSVRDLTYETSQTFRTVTPGMSVTGALVEIGQRHSMGESIYWEIVRDEMKPARTAYPGWKRDRAVLVLCAVVAGFLVGLGVGKHAYAEPAIQPVPTPVVTVPPTALP